MDEKQLEQAVTTYRPLTIDPMQIADIQPPFGDITARCVLEAGQHAWTHEKRGAMPEASQTGFTLTAPTRYATWAPGDPADGDYVGYGETQASLKLDREDWQAYNQIAFTITTACTNIINPNLIVHFKNDGTIKIPDQYDREGHHVINLSDQATHTYLLDIADLPRDAMTAISFSYDINGSYADLPGEYKVTVERIELQQTANQAVTHGWQPQIISYSHDGYAADASKIAVLPGQQTLARFGVVDAEGTVAFAGKPEVTTTTTGIYTLLDFSALKAAGEYRLQWADQQTPVFPIGPLQQRYGSTIPKVLNFIFSERCGYPVPGIHSHCHDDVIATHNGEEISFNGGWHDAGDLSQQTVHTAEAAEALFAMAKTLRKTNAALATRLQAEGEWGLDFVLKTDFGDGYHATSAGVSRWTDNRRGTMDDAKARVHNSAYDNYLLSGIVARIARLTPDPAERQRLTAVASRNFGFAEAEFAKHPYATEPIFWEHTLNTSPATYNATVVKAAAALYQLTKNQTYLNRAREAMTSMLACQESVGLTLTDGRKLAGMFYRDEKHRVFQHFNHQARESLFGEAFKAALALPITPAAQAEWQKRARAYGDYLLYLQQFTAPYPMIASGVYFDDEVADKASFDKQHLLIGDEAYRDYQTQLAGGVQIAPHLFVKRFPVWYSFRGNNGVILATAESAALMGQVLADPKLAALADGQLRWIVGNNPFDQSLLYGEGHHYQSQYSNSSGEIIGEMPVGVETKENEDVPYWPQFNNATYKEVWIVTATKWLAVLRALIEMEDCHEQ